MVKCLDIDEKAFSSLNTKQQNLVLYKNVIEVKQKITGYKLYYKITMIMGSALTATVVFILKMLSTYL